MKGSYSLEKVLIISISITFILIFAFILFFSVTSYAEYAKTHFKNNTYINNVDCSNLTVEEAFLKINHHMKNAKLTFLSTTDTHTILADKFNIQISNIRLLDEIILKQANGDKNNSFDLIAGFKVNNEELEKYLKDIPELLEENMVKPQDAYLKFNSNLFEIVAEVNGNDIKFENAYFKALSDLQNGKIEIDFKPITNSIPKIVATNTNLISQRDKINSILKTTIKYELPNGTNFSLNSSIMKDWVTKNKDGIYSINTEKGIKSFVDTLASKITKVSSKTTFKATNIGNTNIYVNKNKQAILNKQKEIEQINSELNSSKSCTRSPIYTKSPIDLTNIKSYVEIDISRQKIWMYLNGKCIINSSCVTGNASAGHSTPAGVYYLDSKSRNVYLKGNNDDGSKYSSFVNYWMPFNGGVGLHDATWRNNFGGIIYKSNGSHGCVNLPYSVARTIYNNIYVSMPIIVYYS